MSGYEPPYFCIIHVVLQATFREKIIRANIWLKCYQYRIPIKPPFGEDRILAFVTQQKFTIKELEAPEFYVKRGLLQTAKDSKAFGSAGIKQNDFPCQTITLKTYPKGKRPSALPKQRVVLLVGPTIYQWAGYRPLPACLNDVKLLTAIFSDFGHIDAIGVICR